LGYHHFHYYYGNNHLDLDLIKPFSSRHVVILHLTIHWLHHMDLHH
jgi:hypothetical protein